LAPVVRVLQNLQLPLEAMVPILDSILLEVPQAMFGQLVVEVVVRWLVVVKVMLVVLVVVAVVALVDYPLTLRVAVPAILVGTHHQKEMPDQLAAVLMVVEVVAVLMVLAAYQAVKWEAWVYSIQ
jgi:hypothetical protein